MGTVVSRVHCAETESQTNCFVLSFICSRECKRKRLGFCRELLAFSNYFWRSIRIRLCNSSIKSIIVLGIGGVASAGACEGARAPLIIFSGGQRAKRRERWKEGACV